MLQEVFYWIFNMSITAAITGIFVMLVRSIKRVPKRLTILLWMIPFLRMTVPFGLDSPYSLMALLSKITTKTIVVYHPAEDVSFSMINSVMAADGYFPITYKVNILEDVFRIASVIWMMVFLTIVLMLVVIYFTTLHEMQDAGHFQDRIYFSHKITSPAVYGIIKPKIILPKSYMHKDMKYVLLHEAMHIRRRDNLWRMLAFLVAAVHWFNPFSWIFLKLFLTDLELSCDECVLLQLDDVHVKGYARSLLESKESMNVFASAFGGARIRVRIENILSFKKMTRFSLLAFFMLIVVIFHVLLTNAG